MDPIERLTSLFEKFPGIGPRQAGRFVNYLLRNATIRRELADALQSASGSVRQCPDCMRFHGAKSKICSICAHHERDRSALAVVASDADLAALERSGNFRGTYFVLGGTISLASDSAKHLRLQQLLDSIDARDALKEIILAFPANPEGDATSARLRDELSEYKGRSFIISTLGRGLSTGSELEYADPETIKAAIDTRR